MLCETDLKSEPFDLKSTDDIYYSMKLHQNFTAGNLDPWVGVGMLKRSDNTSLIFGATILNQTLLISQSNSRFLEPLFLTGGLTKKLVAFYRLILLLTGAHIRKKGLIFAFISSSFFWGEC